MLLTSHPAATRQGNPAKKVGCRWTSALGRSWLLAVDLVTITFFAGFNGPACSAAGVLGADACTRPATRLVLVDDVWFGAAACDDEAHAALAVQWSVAHARRCGWASGVPLDARQRAALHRSGREGRH